ncbi:Cupredoxins domain-containing protein [Dioscorea alata]|uniref:Cupredoxins domain-containing protein n=1 Tax=Dioscorea alata TaxID=55571 RepID=A0ACB7WAH4_DIOAL|nr:Cupredoxins domain-containing protein [Dioscorea alata]
MEVLKKSVMFLALVLLLALMLNNGGALAKKHEVGGDQGWDVSTDFGSWASSITFRVGDQLVFTYTPGLHTVVELAGEKEYNKCDLSGALKSMSDGKSTVKLSKAGYRYFACGTMGHCQEGMKLKIKTLATNEVNDSNTSSSSPSSTAVTFSHPPHFISHVIFFFIFLGLLVL